MPRSDVEYRYFRRADLTRLGSDAGEAVFGKAPGASAIQRCAGGARGREVLRQWREDC